jgi:membrane protease YdiL (CAAX protease family)
MASPDTVALVGIDAIPYDGSWERAGRSTNAAAVVGLLGIGFVYFQAQSILTAVAIMLSAFAHGFSGKADDRVELMLTILKEHKGEIWTILAFSQYVFMLLPTLWLVKKWHSSRVFDYIRLRKSSFPELVLAVVTAAAFLPTSIFIARTLIRLLHIPESLLQANAELFTARSRSQLASLLFVVALTPAICEEIFFRGFAQRTFERTVGVKSVLIMGITFGLFHMQPLGLFTLSVLGIALGYFYYQSRSLLPSMAAHFTNNALVILLNFRSPGSERFMHTVEHLSVPWMVITLAFSAGTMYLFHVAAEIRKRTSNAGAAASAITLPGG